MNQSVPSGEKAYESGKSFFQEESRTISSVNSSVSLPKITPSPTSRKKSSPLTPKSTFRKNPISNIIMSVDKNKSGLLPVIHKQYINKLDNSFNHKYPIPIDNLTLRIEVKRFEYNFCKFKYHLTAMQRRRSTVDFLLVFVGT